MDPKLFEQLLSTVSEWSRPKIEDSEPKRRAGRPRESEPESEPESIDENPTLPPEIAKIKTQACVCEDCGQYCEQGRHKEKKIYMGNGRRHWREKCMTCKHFQNPYTGRFDLPIRTAAQTWNSFLRDVKQRYKVKESNTVIRKYPETKEPL